MEKIKPEMPKFTTKPTEFVGQWIKVNGQTMLWQDNIILKGYVNHP